MGVRWGKEPLTGCDQNSPQWGREQLPEAVREGYPEKVMFQLSLNMFQVDREVGMNAGQSKSTLKRQGCGVICEGKEPQL